MSATSGLPFSMANLSMRLQGEFNKPALAHLSFGLVGTYGVGQRVNDLASMPLIALQEALWPKLYSHQDPLNQLRRTGIILLLMAAMCSSAIWLTAPVVPLLFGNDFNGITHVMRIRSEEHTSELQ